MTLPYVVNSDAALGLLRARFLATSEIQDLVAGRIYGASAADPDVGTMTKPCLVIEVLPGGWRDRSGAIAQIPFQLGALSMIGASEARDLYAVALAALQGEGLTDTTELHRGIAVEKRVGMDQYIEAAKAWACVGTWELTVTRDRS
jgi:hypothetical protein